MEIFLHDIESITQFLDWTSFTMFYAMWDFRVYFEYKTLITGRKTNLRPHYFTDINY